MQTKSLPTAGLRKYLANILRNQRQAIRKFVIITAQDVIRRDMLKAALAQTRFIARDVNYFGQNPEVLA